MLVWLVPIPTIVRRWGGGGRWCVGDCFVLFSIYTGLCPELATPDTRGYRVPVGSLTVRSRPPPRYRTTRSQRM